MTPPEQPSLTAHTEHRSSSPTDCASDQATRRDSHSYARTTEPLPPLRNFHIHPIFIKSPLLHDKNDLRIVFLGTPDFAVESLRRIVDGGYNVVGVVTMPDKPAGRGHKLYQSPVKEFALAQGLHLMQPVRLKDPEFIEELRSLEADLFIVIAFRMLPEVVRTMPRLGTFNLHASLLPRYRGAAPINWAVINGDTETGVTTFFLKHEIDTGDIIARNASRSCQQTM